MDRQQAQLHRPDYGNTLRLLQKRGFVPRTVIDAGAAEGAFFLFRQRAGLYPQARHFFVDAMRENEAAYRSVAARFPAAWEIGALGAEEGEAVLRIDPGYYNTHIDRVQVDAPYQETRRVPRRTLDSLAEKHGLEPPYMLMIDVQGHELDVLAGATKVLRNTVVVTTEIQIFSGRDTLPRLLAHMDAAGWALYDLTNLAYFVDWTLYQCYATFIPKAREFRSAADWAGSAEERDALLEALRERRAANLAQLEALAKG